MKQSISVFLISYICQKKYKYKSQIFSFMHFYKFNFLKQKLINYFSKNEKRWKEKILKTIRLKIVKLLIKKKKIIKNIKTKKKLKYYLTQFKIYQKNS